MNLKSFLLSINRQESEIIELTGEKALEAVKSNGDALQYVKEQTVEVCLEAVKSNGDALRYVNKKIFIETTTVTTTTSETTDGEKSE